MKLTELFTGDRQITEAAKPQSKAALTAMLNRQIRAMVPGQTIQGEVLSKNGNELQIKLADDMVLLARLEQSMNLEVGKSMLFEVKNNGRALTLSPLFTNVATDANVMKALDMASLPINNTSVSLTKQLMEAGLPIDRQSLQQAYREVNQFMQAEVSDIVNLHKMQMPVNESNVNQMVSYRNLTHQLVNGMNQVVDSIPEMLAHMVQNGDAEGAVQLYQQLSALLGEGGTWGNGPVDGSQMSQATPLQNPATVSVNINGQEVILQITDAPTDGMANQALNALFSGSDGQNAPVDAASAKVTIEDNTTQTASNQIAESSGVQAEGIPTETSANTGIQMQKSTPQTVQITPEQLVSLLREGKVSLEDKKTTEPLLQMLKEQWTISPEEVADSEKVEQLYGRLNKQLKSMIQTLDAARQSNTTTFKSVSNMSQNIDFMQQMNQMYTYVQLPLRLQHSEAHGDLYVYTNKKNLADKEGAISALLHLDMEHLGPVDVYVSLHHENVNTKFYLRDDEMLDFINEHMDILTARLQKRGYHCTYEMLVRNQEEEGTDGIKKMLQQENPIPLSEYAFDIRA